MRLQVVSPGEGRVALVAEEALLVLGACAWCSGGVEPARGRGGALSLGKNVECVSNGMRHTHQRVVRLQFENQDFELEQMAVNASGMLFLGCDP